MDMPYCVPTNLFIFTFICIIVNLNVRMSHTNDVAGQGRDAITHQSVVTSNFYNTHQITENCNRVTLNKDR